MAAAKGSALDRLLRVHCPKAQHREGPHYMERETESQRGDKHCPSSCSKGAAELKQKARSTDSSFRALSMTSCVQLNLV